MNQVIQSAIYVLCLLASGACSLLLLRGYRRTGTRLLLWTAICFFLLCLNSLAVLFDLLILPAQDLQAWRHALSLMAVTVLLIGLVWESE